MSHVQVICESLSSLGSNIGNELLFSVAVLLRRTFYSLESLVSWPGEETVVDVGDHKYLADCLVSYGAKSCYFNQMTCFLFAFGWETGIDVYWYQSQKLIVV